MTSLPFDLELPIADDPAALPAKPDSTFRWATVVNLDPLSIRLDGETTPLSATPSSLDSAVQPGDRVWVHLHGRAVIVLGRGQRKTQFVSGTDLHFPMYIAHRGARSVYPEASVESQRIMAAKGYPTEVDVRALADDTLVACHDATVDRTMFGVTGNVSSLTKDEWRNARIKPVVKGGITGTPLFFDEWLGDMSRSGITPVFEVKDDAIVDDVIASVRWARLERTVIAQSFSFEVASEMARAGIRTLYLFSGWWPPESSAEIADAGIWGVGASTGAADSSLEGFHNDDLSVFVYTINDPSVAELWLDRPHIDGIFSDDPEYASRRVVSRPSDTFDTGFLSPGCLMYVYNSDGFVQQFHLEGAALTIPAQPNNGGRPWVAVPELSPRTNHFRVTFDIDMGANAGNGYQGASPGIVLWRNTVNQDLVWRDEAYAGQEGFTAVARRNGQLEAWKYVNGAAASSIGSSLVQSGKDQFAEAGRPGYARFVFEVTGSRVSMWSPSHSWHFESNENFAPGGLTLGLRGDNKMASTFSNIRVVDL